MESEDDIHDASDLDDDLYSSETEISSDDSDGSEDIITSHGHRQKKNYTILSEADIRQRQEEDVSRVSTLLSLPRVSACILLRHYNWSVSKVHDQWFADQETVCKAVGLLENPVEMPNDRELFCKICLEFYPRDLMSAAACGHPFCGECWRGYMRTSINDGPRCLMLRCPHPSCSAAVGQQMINKLATSAGDKDRYASYLVRSYIEDNRRTKWCPAPGCEFAVEINTESGSGYDVCCKCSYSFCWNCTEEAHRPVDCGTVAKWMLKNSAESENVTWLLANTKPCPKCKRPIEKEDGCMHMTCTDSCEFEFCWLCLGDWSEHGEATGGFYACKRYESAKKEGTYDESERIREMARSSLERYTHYYERWLNNQSARDKALADLQSMRTEKVDKLSDSQSDPLTQLEFIIEAWLQIAECRRLLKWTYAYGYYLAEGKSDFFEYLQGEAESVLELLHQCAEKELQIYVDAEAPMEEFNNFRNKLVGLTRVTRSYFENLVGAMERGLRDVSSTTTCSKSWSGPIRSFDDGSSYWSCQYCTYANPSSINLCQMCEQYRYIHDQDFPRVMANVM